MEIVRTPPTETIQALLAASALPIDDLADPAVELWAAIEGDQLLGTVGIQWLDGSALLRSLAVAVDARARGLGATLCDAVIHAARSQGRTELWLLTTSARDYFSRRGFEVVARDQAPAALRQTAQFASLCPASATIMRRAL